MRDRSSFLAIRLAVLLLSASLGPPADAVDTPQALDILQAMVERHGLDHEIETVELELIKKSGRSKTRILERYSLRGQDGLQRLLAVITEPEDLRGTGVLILERGEGGADQWLYLPALGRVKQVAGEDRDNKFMGTDFCYGDLQAEDLGAHSYEMVAIEEIGDRPCYLIEAMPAKVEEAEQSGYSKRLIWVDREILFVRRVEYYDLDGELLKVLENKALEELPGGAWRSGEMVMETVRKGHRSVMKVRERRLDVVPDESLFTVDRLRSWGE